MIPKEKAFVKMSVSCETRSTSAGEINFKNYPFPGSVLIHPNLSCCFIDLLFTNVAQTQKKIGWVRFSIGFVLLIRYLCVSNLKMILVDRNKQTFYDSMSFEI